jgi:2-oxoisovalerate dehydrogenase E2 component (dihydrolipoyl transacylase)
LGTYVFKLPDVGEGVAEAEIVAWHVEVGETVKEDQPLVDIMTEKATVEIGSPVAGKILSRKGEKGDVASVGDELVTIATEEEAKAIAPAATAAVPAEPTSRPSDQPQAVVPSEHKPTAAPAVRTPSSPRGLDATHRREAERGLRSCLPFRRVPSTEATGCRWRE